MFYFGILIFLGVWVMFYTLFYYFGATGELADIVKEIIRGPDGTYHAPADRKAAALSGSRQAQQP